MNIEKNKVYQNCTRNQKVIVTNVTKDWVFYKEMKLDLRSFKNFSCTPERFKNLFIKLSNLESL